MKQWWWSQCGPVGPSDLLAPTVQSLNSPESDGVYGLGATLDIQVVFSEPVIVAGAPQLALNSGGVATYVSGSGTDTLVFEYSPGFGDDAADLDAYDTSSLTLEGGSIEDAAGNPATLTLPSPGGAGSLSFVKELEIFTNAFLAATQSMDAAFMGSPHVVGAVDGGESGLTLGDAAFMGSPYSVWKGR